MKISLLLVLIFILYLRIRRHRPEHGRFVDWPPPHSADLYVSLESMTLNSIAIGDHLQRAQVFGQPQATHPDEDPDYLSLLFPESGLILEFENECLLYIGILLAPGSEEPDTHHIQWATPELALPHQAPIKFSDQTSIEQVRSILGDPTQIETDSDEVILTYQRQNHTMEFEFNSSQKLRRWNLFKKTQAR